MAKSPYIKEGSLYQVGDVMHSMLGESDFNDLHGGGWVLMDGRSVVGTAYEAITGQTNVPNVGGRVLRAKNNGSGVNPTERAIGDFENDTTAANGLSASSNGSHFHQLINNDANSATTGVDPTSSNYLRRRVFDAEAGTGFAYRMLANNNVADRGRSSSAGSHGHTITGEPETRMVNMTVNIYVKVD